MPERMMVTCPGCDGVVSVSPTGNEAEVRCLKCDEVVYARNAEGGEWWAKVPVPVVSQTPEVSATASKAEWMLPAGWVTFGLGIAGFIASYNVGGGGTVNGGIVAGLLNPLFFVGVPLGLYWLLDVRNKWARADKATRNFYVGFGFSLLVIYVSVFALCFF
jgi:hypothetical protein